VIRADSSFRSDIMRFLGLTVDFGAPRGAGDLSHGRSATEANFGWTAQRDGARTVIALAGDWIARQGGLHSDAQHSILAAGVTTISFDATRLGRWDSALIVFLSDVYATAQSNGVTVDTQGLPSSSLQLLKLTTQTGQQISAPATRLFLDRAGLWAISAAVEAGDISALLGNCLLRGGSALAGHAQMRKIDLLNAMRDAGPGALPIVTVINLLVGGILAFVGAVQLRSFGADIYVASLVGIAVVREMAALMTAIIMAGRSGGAFAAHIATMQGNEEIDALRVFGIPLFDYLILPRVLALTAMMPILYLYGCAVGIAGGFVVACATLTLSPISYFEEIRQSILPSQFFLGISKTLVFGMLIAILSCRIGLRAGRSAADVGKAATDAVVANVVGVIAIDAIFDLCAQALSI
jgi:phospholipid/cholesterol/gamma-HCH transport system permease protein